MAAPTSCQVHDDGYEEVRWHRQNVLEERVAADSETRHEHTDEQRSEFVGLPPSDVRRWLSRKAWGTPHLKDAVRRHQGDRCPICGQPSPHRADSLHDFGEGGIPRVRLLGLLCDRCKPGIDMFDHDPVLLTAALAYLARPPAQEVCRQLQDQEPVAHDV